MRNTHILMWLLILGCLFACLPAEKEQTPEDGDGFNRNTGSLISQDLAARKLQLYKSYEKRHNPNYNDSTNRYGFAFGINEFKEFYEKIEAFNKQYPDSISGVRVYFAGSEVREQKLDTLPDVFLIPIVFKRMKNTDGTWEERPVNLYPIDPGFDYLGETPPSMVNFRTTEDLILDHGLGCPSICH